VVEGMSVSGAGEGDARRARDLDVVIVGAGAAGVGSAIALRSFGIERFTILERAEVGASFLAWPAEMRFITPSFTSNGFGLLDLNAVAPGTSPAFATRREHMSGAEYASYLRAVVDYFSVPVETGVHVSSIQPAHMDGGFLLHTSAGTIFSRHVVWAAGEFQYPDLLPFRGAELAIHASRVQGVRPYDGHGGAASTLTGPLGRLRAGRTLCLVALSHHAGARRGNGWR
jgi:cation diffusion facilitator CzcD-associated flavoprotein CzcO